MKDKDCETLRQHIKNFGSQELIDRSYGTNKYKNKILELMKEYKIYNTHIFVGELLVDVRHVKWLIARNFYGGFNEREHYLIIESKDDLQSFKDFLSENKNEEKLLEDTRKRVIASLKNEFKEDEEVISNIIDQLDNFKKTKNKRESFEIMSDVLYYVKNKKLLNTLFGVGTNHYRQLEKDLGEDKYGDFE